MIQKEVADKISTLAEKKSYLWWLVNYAYQVNYLKTVPAKAFSPAPKVTSAVVGFLPSPSPEFPKGTSFEEFVRFLDDFSPFSRKTLGAISKMVAKKTDHIRKIPSELSGKRLEACTWDQIEKCLLD
jgi:16S rRNA A1518/A1519 N6-dimethyltransferase RsmA/KsgA/DIM1 with predicted DNA glycosylase/AP lyase activity